MSKRGKFITIEGIEGVGKTTHLRFIVQQLQARHLSVLATREPGGTPLADAIRALLLAEHDEIMYPDTELLLLFAARAQHIARVIKPALQAGTWVVCDRFTDSSYAYQGAGRGIAMEKIRALETLVQGPLHPDLTILLDAPLNFTLTRIKRRLKVDRFENEQRCFFERVRQRYLHRAKSESQRFRLVSTEHSKQRAQETIARILKELG